MNTLDVGFVAVEMAAHLRAGSPTVQAWRLSVRAARGGQDIDSEAGWQETIGRNDTGVDNELVQVITDYCQSPSRPPCWGVWRAMGGGWRGIRAYALEWKDWWWSRSLAAQRQRRALETLRLTCIFSAVVGAPLAEMLTRLGRSIDRDDADEEAREVAAAGPSVSARILNTMPLLGMGGAWMLGADPLHFFMSSLLGLIVAVVGVVFAVAGNVVSARMVAHARPAPFDDIDPAVACDLVAAGLEGGAAIPRVLDALGEVSGVGSFCEVGSALVHGVEWPVAWEGVPADFSVLSHVLQPAWEEGVSPVPACERAAMRLRQQRGSESRRQAARLNVKLVVPLGVLMLPSFIALGIVPLLVALAQGG